MQLLLPSSVNFQVTPSDVNFDSIARKMYQPKRTLMYPKSPYARGVSGLAVLNYYDLLAQAGLQNCDPMDSACVSNNVAKEAAVEDFWAAHQATGVADDTRLTFTPQTTAEVREFYNPVDLFNSGNVVDTRGIMQVSGSILPAQQYAPTPAPVKPNQSVPPTTPLTPMQTGFQNTAQTLVQQAAANQAGQTQQQQQQSQQQTGSGKILGIDQKTFLIGAAILGGAILLGGRK